MKRSEPSLKELILAQVVTGRLQDAALCYERLAQEGQLDRRSLQVYFLFFIALLDTVLMYLPKGIKALLLP